MYKGFDLSGKVAVLTGSTAGMGFAIARGLAQCGAKVVVSSNTQEDTDDGAHRLASEGFDVKGVRCDITSRGDITRFGEQAKRAFGRADILFCLAAPSPPVGPTIELGDAQLDTMLMTMVTNNLVLIRQFIPEMAERRDGSIVVMSSNASMQGNPILGGYGASKAALNGIVRSIAVEFGASNVRVNALAPSLVRTAFSKILWSDPECEKAFISRIPAGRIAEVEDVVGPALLLASPAGAYVTGQVLLIDGGCSVA
jgi:dehydrogenase/reductase SDR family protein 4